MERGDLLVGRETVTCEHMALLTLYRDIGNGNVLGFFTNQTTLLASLGVRTSFDVAKPGVVARMSTKCSGTRARSGGVIGGDEGCEVVCVRLRQIFGTHGGSGSPPWRLQKAAKYVLWKAEQEWKAQGRGSGLEERGQEYRFGSNWIFSGGRQI